MLENRTLFELKRDGGTGESRWHDTGDMTSVPAGQASWRLLKGKPDLLRIFVNPRLISEVAAAIYEVDACGISILPRHAVRDQTLECLGRLLLAEAEVPNVGMTFAVDMLARSLALQLLRCHSSMAPRMPKPPALMPAKHLQRVIEFVHANLESPLSLSQLALISGMSPSQFARSFRQATGVSPLRYVTEIRMDLARDLLENSRLPIIQIGLQCGFDRPSHFATTFRKCVGMNPRAWRSAAARDAERVALPEVAGSMIDV